MQHLGVAQLLGDPETVDQQFGVRPQGAAAFVDAAGDGLGAFGRQEAGAP